MKPAAPTIRKTLALPADLWGQIEEIRRREPRIRPEADVLRMIVAEGVRVVQRKVRK